MHHTHTEMHADTGIQCTESRFQEVTSTSVGLATGSTMRFSLTCCSVMWTRSLQTASTSKGKRMMLRMEGDGQQTDNSPSASSGQVAVGNTPLMFKAVGLGGDLHPSQRRPWEASQMLDTPCQASLQQFL